MRSERSVAILDLLHEREQFRSKERTIELVLEDCTTVLVLCIDPQSAPNQLQRYVDLRQGDWLEFVNGRKAVARSWRITLADGRTEVLKK